MAPRSSLVLMVDLTTTVIAMLSRALQRAGYRVEVAAGPAMVADVRARFTGPVCVVAGITPHDRGGAQKVERLRWAGVGAPIIIVAERADVGAAVAAMKAGAFDVLVEPVNPDAFVTATARAVDSDAAAESREQLLGNIRRNYARLTARERDVLYAVTDGMLNKQAADRLGITEKTIKVHRASVMKKMGADSLPDLVRMVDAHRHSCGWDHSWSGGDDPEAAVSPPPGSHPARLALRAG